MNARDVERVNVVADLLALVAEHACTACPRGCIERGSSGIHAAPRPNGSARSGSRRAGSTWAYRSSGRTPAPSRRPRPSTRRTANASIGRSGNVSGMPVRVRRVGVVPPRLLLRQRDRVRDDRRTPCWSTCGRRAIRGTRAAPLRAGSACRPRWYRNRRTGSPRRDRATAGRPCARWPTGEACERGEDRPAGPGCRARGV